MKNTRASKTVALGATVAMVTAITGCSVSDSTETTETYAILCQNLETGERVPDEECENAGDAVDKVENLEDNNENNDENNDENNTHTSSNSSFVFLPLWLNSGGTVPAVGEKVEGNDIRTTKPTTGHGYYMGSNGGNIENNGRVVAKPGTNNRANPGKSNSGHPNSGKSSSRSSGGFGSKGGGATGSGSHGG